MLALHVSASIKCLKTNENASMFYSISFLKRMTSIWEVRVK